MEYIDAFMAAVPRHDQRGYLDHAKQAAVLFKKYGAIRVVENWGDDLPEGDLTSMPMAVQCQPNETVVLSWVIWPSKAVRDEGMSKLFSDPEMQEMELPFDSSRLIYGGFQVIMDE
jgi:uncharacterized protein YbaA (DUF1428 family)